VKTVRITLLLVLALLLLAAVPVSAGAPPLIEDWTYDVTAQWEWAPCDFPVMEHEVLRARTKTFADDTGKKVHLVISFHGGSTFSTPVNPGFELETKIASAVFRWDEAGQRWSVTGVSGHVTIPGYGAVLLRSGKWSDYPFGHDAGKDTFESEEDSQAFCAYLAGTLPAK
jgi:hypothetical protein